MKIKLNKTTEDIKTNMLTNRGLTVEEVNNLLNPTKKMVESISHYNVEKGIDMYLNSIKNNELIATLVDVDADGYCSSSIVYQVTTDEFGYENIVYILQDGKIHGLTRKVVDKLLNSDVKLLIIPDAGSDNIKLLKEISTHGISVLILDHHIIELPMDELNSLHNIVLVNCQNGIVENKYLSGTGVTYKFFSEVAKKQGIKLRSKYLDLVALSLITDVCDMKFSFENRYYLSQGSKISKITNPLIELFKEKLKKKSKDKFSITEFGFEIGPKINAIIRYGTLEEKEILFNAMIGVEELLPNKKTYQQETYTIGSRYQRIQRESSKEIIPLLNDIVEETKANEKPVIFIDGTDIVPKEIKGLLCNKMLDIYKKPIMISTLDNGIYSGSSRSIKTEQLSDFKSFCEKSQLFEWVRGHNNAHGHKIKKENIPKFLEYCDNNLDMQEYQEEVENIYVNEIPLEDVVEIANYEELWCNQIEPPKYLLKGVCLTPESIVRAGSSTYNIIIGDVKFTKEFGSLAWYNEVLDEISKTGLLNVELIVEFRQQKNKQPYAKIIEMRWEHES